MMRHAMAEGWLLVRQRWVVSLVLAIALAVPISLAGVGLRIFGWLQPMATHSSDTTTVAVLLHPRLDDDGRRRWIEQQAKAHPDWMIAEVTRDELIARLSRWYPYLESLLSGSDSQLPPLIEITTSVAADVAGLENNPGVLAIGPLASIDFIIGTVTRRLVVMVAVLSIMLLAGAVLLSGVWVHLELYRHAAEVTIMRLVGATEGTVRGPFVVAVTLPGLLAGLLSVAATMATTATLSNMTLALGLSPISASPMILALQLLLAVLLPAASATMTLARHASDPVAS
jgi:cell division transport system permease protein